MTRAQQARDYEDHLTASHEMGHMLAAYLYGARFRYVTMRPHGSRWARSNDPELRARAHRMGYGIAHCVYLTRVKSPMAGAVISLAGSYVERGVLAVPRVLPFALPDASWDGVSGDLLSAIRKLYPERFRPLGDATTLDQLDQMIEQMVVALLADPPDGRWAEACRAAYELFVTHHDELLLLAMRLQRVRTMSWPDFTDELAFTREVLAEDGPIATWPGH